MVLGRPGQAVIPLQLACAYLLPLTVDEVKELFFRGRLRPRSGTTENNKSKDRRLHSACIVREEPASAAEAARKPLAFSFRLRARFNPRAMMPPTPTASPRK